MPPPQGPESCCAPQSRCSLNFGAGGRTKSGMLGGRLRRHPILALAHGHPAVLECWGRGERLPIIVESSRGWVCQELSFSISICA
eukprot:14561099-Alexandrium_andersonii.AAC.1